MKIPECAVCFVDLSENLVSLKCGHVFHNTCIANWLGKHSSQKCPLCRSSFTSKAVVSLQYRVESYLDHIGSDATGAVPDTVVDATLRAELKGRVEQLNKLKKAVEKKTNEAATLMNEKAEVAAELELLQKKREKDQSEMNEEKERRKESEHLVSSLKKKTKDLEGQLKVDKYKEVLLAESKNSVDESWAEIVQLFEGTTDKQSVLYKIHTASLSVHHALKSLTEEN
eukprot:Trichotokara_eunicae@DN1702_c0_g1_i2.p1